MLEVGEDIERINLVKAFNPLILSLGPDAVAFENAHVKVRPNNTCTEVLASQCDGTSADERVVNKVSWVYLGLVGHQACDFMIC